MCLGYTRMQWSDATGMMIPLELECYFNSCQCCLLLGGLRTALDAMCSDAHQSKQHISTNNSTNISTNEV